MGDRHTREDSGNKTKTCSEKIKMVRKTVAVLQMKHTVALYQLLLGEVVEGWWCGWWLVLNLMQKAH